MKSIMIRTEQDIHIAINMVRTIASAFSYSNVDIQKVMVTTSELTQNILDHTGRPGFFTCEYQEGVGLRIIVKDNGRGIKDIKKILQGDADFPKKGLGLGLVGAKRLMDEFIVETSERGTSIIAIKRKK